MGKNGKFGKDYGRVVGKDSQSRPGWKGPGFVKKVDTSAATASTKARKPDVETSNHIVEPAIPIELQQLLLNVFRNAFPEVLASDELQSLLQDVKAALYERDFNRAFGKETFLEAYSVRWSPSRSLCYASVLFELRRHLKGLFPAAVVDGQNKDAKCPASPANTPQASLRTVCFGGGAAEVVGFGGFLRSLHETVLHTSPALQSNQEVTAAAEALENLSLTDEALVIDLLLVDSAQWGDVVRTLHHELTSPPPLSKYASTSAKEANSALIEPRSITAGFRAEDILEMSQSQISEIVGGKQLLVTLLFTLNELYTASIGKTTSFLLNLTTAVSAGSLLLVVDSPGSYSETTIGTEAKKYPMLWLLNHTLLETEKSRGKESMASWSKVVSDESQWFRLHEKLRYPISLENMRYQVHLYRRT